jgi:hypothetical protein
MRLARSSRGAGAVPDDESRGYMGSNRRQGMKLDLAIDTQSLNVELDDVIVGLLAVRLGLPSEGEAWREAVSCHLGDVGGPWMLDENHMRKRILRRLILEVADPALMIRYLMIEQPQ